MFLYACTHPSVDINSILKSVVKESACNFRLACVNAVKFKKSQTVGFIT